MYSFFYPRPIPLWCNYCQYNIPATKGFNKEYDDEDNYRWMHGEDRLSEDKQMSHKKQYTPTASGDSQTGMQNHEDKDKEVYKDEFVSGFVPNHNHGSVDYTSLVDGHVHQCLDVTFPPTPSEDGTHIHYTEGYALFEDGHNHCYKTWSGPAIPVGNGMHVHNYDFYTTVDDGHRHHIRRVDIPAPGTL